MAAVAHAKGLEVEVASFEQWDDRGRRFELAICAQAWHWIEPRAGAAGVSAGRVRIAPTNGCSSEIDAIGGSFEYPYETVLVTAIRA